MDKQPSSEDYREVLKDVATIVERLGPLAGSFDNLVRILQLAQDDDAQLAFVMAVMTNKKTK